MTSRFQHEVRMKMDKDVNDFRFTKGLSASQRNDPYKYGSKVNGEIIEGNIPEWAQKAIDANRAAKKASDNLEY